MDYPVVHLFDVDELDDDAEDPEIIRWCKQHNHVWVTQDLKSLRITQHGPLIRETGISVAWFRPPSKRGWSHKECLRVFLKWIDDIVNRYSGGQTVLHQYSSRTNKSID